MATALIIGHNIPEPTTTAAGGRMMQLIELYQSYGYKIVLASTASVGEHSVDLEELGITFQSIELNSDSFDEFIKETAPDIVTFDRFMTEEQFGWRVSETCPNAIKILDTEDLHFLRKARHEAIKKKVTGGELNLYTDLAKREIASILRCDLSLIISEAEMNILTDQFSIDEDLLFYLPILNTNTIYKTPKSLPGYNGRSGFMTIGNLLHDPNKDAVIHLKSNIWPLIRKQLPKATLSIYGNYAPQHITDLHSEKDGFLIEGWAPSIEEVMTSAKVCLAPLRFGAGLKGKIIDAMNYGTPVIATSIGAEGIHGDLPFCGIVEDDDRSFAEDAVSLYNDPLQWLQFQSNGFEIIKQRFEKSLFIDAFKDTIEKKRDYLDHYRQNNFIGQILQREGNQAAKYLSKWIQAKNA